MRCRWLLVAAAALAGASGLPAGADAAEAAAQQVPQAYSAPVPGAAVEAPGSGAAPAGAAVVDDLARFLEVTAQNSAALHSQEGHKARHKHRARHHLSEAELERRAAHYAKWAAKVWAPRTYYEHYYSHPAMGGQYYPQQGQQQQQQQGHPEQQQQQFHDGPPRFAERRADDPQHPASLLDHIAGIRSAAETRASAPMAYSGPMDQQQQGQQGQQGQQQAPSLLEAGAGAGAGSGSPAYGMSQDSALTSGGAYGPPMSEGPTDSLFAQQAPQQQQQAQAQQQQVPLQQQQQMMQMRLREQMMQQPAPPQQQQQMLPQQQLQYQQQAMQQPLFAPPQQPGQFAFRQQFQQQEAQGSMPSTQGQAMQFYAPTAFPPPAPNQVPFSNAQVNAAYPAQQQAPTTANMRFQAVGSTVQPPFDTNQQPMNPNAPRYQNEQANQYPFGGSLLEVDESAPVDLGEEEAPAGTIHPDVYLAARHPYRNSVRSPLTAQHMERFPELDEFTLPGSL